MDSGVYAAVLLLMASHRCYGGTLQEQWKNIQIPRCTNAQVDYGAGPMVRTRLRAEETAPRRGGGGARTNHG